MMLTREVLRWHWSAMDLLEIAALALVVLDHACARLERYIEGER